MDNKRSYYNPWLGCTVNRDLDEEDSEALKEIIKHPETYLNKIAETFGINFVDINRIIGEDK